jgi:hypothetical protein
MTRRRGSRRTTAPAPAADPDVLPSLRRRKPLAFWAAILGAAAIVATTFASLLSAFL